MEKKLNMAREQKATISERKKWQEKNRHLVCPLQVRPEVVQINFTSILQHVCKLRLAANCMSALDGRACNQRTGFLPLFGYVRKKREAINKSSGIAALQGKRRLCLFHGVRV